MMTSKRMIGVVIFKMHSQSRASIDEVAGSCIEMRTGLAFIPLVRRGFDSLEIGVGSLNGGVVAVVSDMFMIVMAAEVIALEVVEAASYMMVALELSTPVPYARGTRARSASTFLFAGVRIGIRLVDTLVSESVCVTSAIGAFADVDANMRGAAAAVSESTSA